MIKIQFNFSFVSCLTVALVAKETRQLALAALLFIVGQQLVDELPDQLLGWSVQHWKHVHDQGVHVPANTRAPYPLTVFFI